MPDPELHPLDKLNEAVEALKSNQSSEGMDKVFKAYDEVKKALYKRA